MCRDQIRIVDHVEGSMEMAHLPKRALPDHLDRLKVVHTESASFQSAKERLFSLGKKEFPI